MERGPAGTGLSNRLPDNPTLDVALRHLPMVSLVELTAPSVVAAGLPGLLATAVVWTVTWKTGNLLFAMIGSVVVFALFP